MLYKSQRHLPHGGVESCMSPDEYEGEFPPELDKRLGVYLELVRSKYGISARARHYANLSRKELEHARLHEGFAEQEQEANELFWDAIPQSAAERFVKGVFAGYATNPETGEVREIRKYPDGLFNVLIKMHPEYKNLNSDDSKLVIEVRDPTARDVQADVPTDAPTEVQPAIQVDVVED